MSLAIVFTIMWLRIARTAQFESKIAQTVEILDTNRLKFHLQQISISAVEIDEEVAKLKQDIIMAAHKHHLTVDNNDTNPDSPFDTPEKREHLIRIVEKQKKDITARVS